MDTLLDPVGVLGRLGSFWSSEYGGADQLLRRLDGLFRCAAGLEDDLAAAAAALCRAEVRPARTRRWHPLALVAAERGARPIPYGDGAHAYGRSGLAYGAPSPAVAYPAPGIVGALAIADRPDEPRRVLVRGIDFDVDPARGEVRFVADPLLDPVFNPRGLPEATAWAYRAETSRSDVGIWAEPLAVPGPGTAAHRDVVDAVGRALVGGTTHDALMRFLSAISGTPVASADEPVRAVVHDDGAAVVITPSACYRVGADAGTPLPGERLVPGRHVGDAVAVHHLRDGVPDWLSALVLPPGFFPAGMAREGIGFENHPTALEVGGLREGRRFVRFALVASRGDAARFFERAHANGVAADGGLAALLDLRPSPTDEPAAASLPATVNPLDLAVRAALRGNLILVRLRPGSFGPGAAGTGFLPLLRRLIPPRAAALVVVDLPPMVDSVLWDGPDESPPAPGAVAEIDDGGDPTDPGVWGVGREPEELPCA